MPRSTIAPVSPSFHFEHELRFDPAGARDLLRQIPEQPGILALFGADTSDGRPAQPYLTRAADLRRRIRRLVDPPETLDSSGQPVASKRLNLRDRVARIAWTVTGSEFESLLCLYDATSSLFSADEARRRMKLRTPYFVRLNADHAHPRLYTTNRISRGKLHELYGPFPSRVAAERYTDAILYLFRLRRCYEDLVVHPDHPGCAYGEMKRCMAPCNTGCSAEDYGAEARAVSAFLDTHGESLLAEVAASRAQASEEMDFERAAELHTRWEKVRAAAGLADDLVRPIPQLRAVVAQPLAAPRFAPHREVPSADPASPLLADAAQAEAASIFLLQGGYLAGPERLSTLGVRAVREQTSVGSSLFAQPLMLQAVPLPGAVSASVAGVDSDSPETRAEAALTHLEARATLGRSADPLNGTLDSATLSDHLSLFRRWYYRPEKQRAGEVLLPNPDGSWPIRKLLRAAARSALGEPRTMQATDRDGAKALRTKVLHAGREGIERTVPVIDAPLPKPESFRSRRSRRSSVKTAGSEGSGSGDVSGDVRDSPESTAETRNLRAL